jgi:hypothetical protein
MKSEFNDAINAFLSNIDVDIVEYELMYSYSGYAHSSVTTDCRPFDVESAFPYVVLILIDFCLMIIVPSG